MTAEPGTPGVLVGYYPDDADETDLLAVQIQMYATSGYSDLEINEETWEIVPDSMLHPVEGIVPQQGMNVLRVQGVKR